MEGCEVRDVGCWRGDGLSLARVCGRYPRLSCWGPPVAADAQFRIPDQAGCCASPFLGSYHPLLIFPLNLLISFLLRSVLSVFVCVVCAVLILSCWVHRDEEGTQQSCTYRVRITCAIVCGVA